MHVVKCTCVFSGFVTTEYVNTDDTVRKIFSLKCAYSQSHLYLPGEIVLMLGRGRN